MKKSDNKFYKQYRDEKQAEKFRSNKKANLCFFVSFLIVSFFYYVSTFS